MVVGVLTTSYPRFAGDGAGSFVADDVARLVREGACVQVIAAGDGPPGTTRTVAGPITVTRIGTAAPGAAAPPLFYGDGAPEALEGGGVRAWIAAACFTAALRNQVAAASVHWDAMVSHWLLPCAWTAMAAAPRLPHRAYAHSGDIALLERLSGGRALARQLASGVADIVFVSHDLARRFAALAGRSVGRVQRLVPDGELFRRASAGERAQARRRLGLTRTTVVAAGRLIPIKGFDLLIDAVGDLAARHATAVGERDIELVDIELVILGAGTERERLQSRARQRRVALRLPGAVPRAQLASWMAAGDVYVQPSRPVDTGRTEGLPLATLEALAVGAKVIAARSGGLAELADLSDDVAFFEPGDRGSLCAALSAALAV